MKKENWERYGETCTHVMDMIDKTKNAEELYSAALAMYMLVELNGGDKTFNAHQRSTVTCLAIRIAATPGGDSAYSHFDWADAIAHWPANLDLDALLELNEDEFQRTMDRMAQHKRETYTSEPHEMPIEQVPIQVVVHLYGGLVQNVYANTQMEVKVFDTDSEDPEEQEEICVMEQEIKKMEEDPSWITVY